jgi:hypothetical protein
MRSWLPNDVPGYAQSLESIMKLRSYYLIVIALVVAALPAQAITVNVNQETFVISNEAPGYLITKLIAAGHGGDSPYQVTQFLAGMPGASAAITPAFLAALANCPDFPPSVSQIFSTTLSQYSAASAIAINTDGTVSTASVTGSPYSGQSGVTTVSTGNTAVQNVSMVYIVYPHAPLTSWLVSGPLAGMTTTYNVFAVAWDAGSGTEGVQITPVPPSLWLAIAGCFAVFGSALWARHRGARQC